MTRARNKQTKKTPRPLKSGGYYLVMVSQDGQDWVVCGNKCAANVSKRKASTTQCAIKLALANPASWLFD